MHHTLDFSRGFLGGTVIKNPPTNAGNPRDIDSIPEVGRSPGDGNGNPLQYSCLENPMDGAWWATVHRVAKSRTRLSDFTFLLKGFPGGSVLLPGKSHGWRSLEGSSPWGHWGSDTTERLHFHFSLSCIGEGNGNPLQCSCYLH